MSFVYNHNKLALLGEREYTIMPSLKQLGEINDLLRYEFKAIIMLHIINISWSVSSAMFFTLN